VPRSGPVDVEKYLGRSFAAWEKAVEAHKRHKHEHELYPYDHRPAAEAIRRRRADLERRAWRCAALMLLAAASKAGAASEWHAQVPRSLSAWLGRRLHAAVNGHPIRALNRPVGSKVLSPSQQEAISAALTYVDLAKRGHIPDTDAEATVRGIFRHPLSGKSLPASTWADWKRKFRPSRVLWERIIREEAAGAEGGRLVVARTLLEAFAVEFNGTD
jgi:hypothetical protein